MYIFEGPEQVEIKKVVRPGHFGISSYAGSVTTIGCPITEKGFKTGLTKDEEVYYEQVLDLKSGELSKHSKWWNKFNEEYPIKLNNTKKTTLILDNPINQIKYKILLASNKVANSEISKTPETEFFIDDKELKAKAENEVFNYKMEGMEIIFKMSPEEKKSALRLFGKSGLDTSSESMLKAELGRQLDKDPKEFHRILADINIGIKGWILELVEKGFLRRSTNGFKFGDELIASSMETAVDFFKNPKNHDTKLMLEGSLSGTKKPIAANKFVKDKEGAQ